MNSLRAPGPSTSFAGRRVCDQSERVLADFRDRCTTDLPQSAEPHLTARALRVAPLAVSLRFHNRWNPPQERLWPGVKTDCGTGRERNAWERRTRESVEISTENRQGGHPWILRSQRLGVARPSIPPFEFPQSVPVVRFCSAGRLSFESPVTQTVFNRLQSGSRGAQPRVLVSGE
jgi:hypothetical protein